MGEGPGGPPYTPFAEAAAQLLAGLPHPPASAIWPLSLTNETPQLFFPGSAPCAETDRPWGWGEGGVWGRTETSRGKDRARDVESPARSGWPALGKTLPATEEGPRGEGRGGEGAALRVGEPAARPRSPPPSREGQVKWELPGPCQRVQAGTKTPLKSRSNAQRFTWAWEEAAGFGPHSIMGCGVGSDEAGASVGPRHSPRSPGSPPVRTRRRPQGRVTCLNWANTDHVPSRAVVSLASGPPARSHWGLQTRRPGAAPRLAEGCRGSSSAATGGGGDGTGVGGGLLGRWAWDPACSAPRVWPGRRNRRKNRLPRSAPRPPRMPPSSPRPWRCPGRPALVLVLAPSTRPPPRPRGNQPAACRMAPGGDGIVLALPQVLIGPLSD